MHDFGTNDGSEALRRARLLLARDAAVRDLAIAIASASTDRVSLAWEPPQRCANGQGILHGAYTFLLADTALAYVCATAGHRAVTRGADIVFLAPVPLGTRLTADAEVRRRHGRTLLCDVRVRNGETTFAEFRGTAVIVADI